MSFFGIGRIKRTGRNEGKLLNRADLPAHGRRRLPGKAGSAMRVLSALAKKRKKAPALITKNNDGLCTNLSAFNSQFRIDNPRQRSTRHHHPCHKNLPCDWTPQTVLQPTRIQASLLCGTNDSPHVSFSEVKAGVTLTSVRDRKCLKRVIQDRCRKAHQKIPRVAHYVDVTNVTVETFVSVMSIVRFLRPCLVLFHGHSLPQGPYWRALLHLVPNLMHVPLGKSRDNGKRILEPAADVVKLQILLEYGGVYLDGDYLLLRPLDQLFHHPTVMAITATTTNNNSKNINTPYHLSNGFLMSQAHAPFLKLCLSKNITTHPHHNTSKQTTLPHHFSNRLLRLAQDSPQMVHVLDSFFFPPGTAKTKSEKLHGDKNSKSATRNSKRELAGNYGFRLHTRNDRKVLQGRPLPRLDKQVDKAGAEVVRQVLFGDAAACVPPKS
ncbi:hypothetical protein ACOMHN_054575 [Nucella lapillus]